MHYIIISLIIVGIMICQSYFFFQNERNLLLLKKIFPHNPNDLELIQSETFLEIQTKHRNVIFEIIISSLNKYLRNNKGVVSDYHLMKDIVDRNCDAKEEEIDTQIPVPLYLGLVGTMAGILIGILFLWFSGDLKVLLGAGEGAVAHGVEALLGGVALAMITSIIGIILTTTGSQRTKNTKTEVEKNKNTFLSWIQAELLPNISNDASTALVRMTTNLSKFNSTFAQNTQELKGTLSKVNDSYKIQADLIQAINRLKIADIATANIEVYDKLKNSTNEIGVFAQYLQNTNEYLKTLQGLSQKLDDYERRTQIIENAGKFFTKNERWLAENFDTANLEVNAAIKRFKEKTGDSLTKLQESLNGQILNLDKVMQQQQEKLQETLKITTEIVTESFTKTQQAFEKAISDQQTAFNGKLQETSKLVEELKNLTHIKEGIKEFKEATNKQNQKIEELTREIRALAKAKIEGGTIKQEITLPKWIKISVISVACLISITCLTVLLPLLDEWISNLVNLLF